MPCKLGSVVSLCPLIEYQVVLINLLPSLDIGSIPVASDAIDARFLHLRFVIIALAGASVQIDDERSLVAQTGDSCLAIWKCHHVVDKSLLA